MEIVQQCEKQQLCENEMKEIMADTWGSSKREAVVDQAKTFENAL